MPLECARRSHRQQLGVDRLHQKVVGACAQGSDGGVDAAHAGEHDHGDVRRGPVDALTQRQTVHLIHLQVGDHERDVVELRERLLRRRRRPDAVTGTLQGGLMQFTLIGFVVDKQDQGSVRHQASRRVEAGKQAMQQAEEIGSRTRASARGFSDFSETTSARTRRGRDERQRERQRGPRRRCQRRAL